MVAGWQASWIYSHISGTPFSPLLGYDAARTLVGYTGNLAGQRPDAVAGADLITGDPMQWFNPAAFLRPVPGFLGNAGRNILRGPNLDNLDLSIHKHLLLSPRSEKTRLEFRVEFFNLLNHTNLDIPIERRMRVFNSNSSPDDVGRITSAYPSREIQLGLKVIF
jgi:hypothetical protein